MELAALRNRLILGSPAGPCKSAVMMLLLDSPRGVEVLLTLRSDRLSSHPGELSFPGGRSEARDRSLMDAALRETWEETGIASEDVEAWGHVLDYVTFRNDRVAMFAGSVPRASVPDPTPRNDEVHRVMLVPLDSLREARPRPGHAHPHPAEERTTRGVHACDVEGYYGRKIVADDSFRVIHYWPLLDGHVLWGITADLVSKVLERAFAWKAPSAPTPVRRPEDVIPR